MVAENRGQKTENRKQNVFGKIGVLMGGPSTEREISLKSGRTVYNSLKKANCDVVAIDIKNDDKLTTINLLKGSRIDIAFVALHGRFGEDGAIQKILQELDLPYTGSGVESSMLAMDKPKAREIFKRNNLSVPKYKVFSKKDDRVSIRDLSLPVVVKPARHGSSIGLSIVENSEALNKAIAEAFSFDDRIIIEEYIKGREVTVSILNEEALAVIEIVPKKKFFDYEAKYKVGMSEYIIPANLDKATTTRVQEAGLKAHQALGCSGFSRADIILNGRGSVYVLEVNTIPGLTEMSLLPKAAASIGIDFTHLCLNLLEKAVEKKNKKDPR